MTCLMTSDGLRCWGENKNSKQVMLPIQAWMDVTKDESLNVSSCARNIDRCSYRDQVTHLEWSKIQAESLNWYDAMRFCKNLEWNHHKDWRLPHHSELSEAVIHQMSKNVDQKFISESEKKIFLMTSTTISFNTENVMTGNLSNDLVGLNDYMAYKWTPNRFLCVRDSE